MSTDGMRVPLTQGFYAVVDAEDYADVMRFKWRVRNSGTTHYARRDVRRADGSRTVLELHTYLTGYSLTDHIDGDGLNNRLANLREATTRQNGGNRRSQAGSSAYRGVTWRKDLQKWRTRVQWSDATGRKLERHLGYFTSEEDAARAWDVAARERWGEFASLNFPGPGEQSALR